MSLFARLRPIRRKQYWPTALDCLGFRADGRVLTQLPAGHDGASDDPARTRVIRLDGNLRDDGRICEFRHRCNEVVHAGRRRVVLNLAGVEQADTKLVAILVAIMRRASEARVACEIRMSPCVRTWVTLCRAEPILQLPGAGEVVLSAPDDLPACKPQLANDTERSG